MITTLQNDYVVPQSAAQVEGFVPLPITTPYIEAGSYRIIVCGKVRPASTDAPQAFFKPSFGMPGAPVLSASALFAKIFYPGNGSSGLDGFENTGTQPPEIQTMPPTGAEEGVFLITGTVTISAGGYLSIGVQIFDWLEGKETTFLAGTSIELIPA